MPKLKNPLIRRKTSSPSSFSSLPRKKPSLSRSASSLAKEIPPDRLNDTGSIPSLAPKGVDQDILSLIKYIQEHTWNPIPSVSGMGSQRISEVLRFRESLPPVVSLAHLYALSTSATETEREMAILVRQGVLRKVVVPGRGKGGSAVGEGVVVVADWKHKIQTCEVLREDVKAEYLRLMDAAPTSLTTSVRTFGPEDIRSLVSAGFLTNPSASLSSPTDLFASPSSTPSSSLLSAGHTAPSGSLAAIGGAGAVHEKGGGGSTLATQPHRPTNPTQTHPQHQNQNQPMSFSLPNTGPYLRLLTSSRLHLLALLKQLSPLHRECTLDLLKEKWEGNILGDSISQAKRARGEWRGVLPGKTRAWREFYGIRFMWVLEEAVGAGVVEVFETGVGVLGVRGR